MEKKYLTYGLVAVGGIALASSIFVFQFSEKNKSVAETLVMPEKTVYDKAVQVEDIEQNEYVDDVTMDVDVFFDEMNDMTPPGVVENIPDDLYHEPQNFWEVDENDQGNDPDIYTLNVDPAIITNLQVGQTFEFFVPELNQTFQSNINVTKNSYNGTHIFKGEIIEGRLGENISIVRGKRLTFVTVATLQGVFSATIDNVTGESTLQSEASLNKNMHAEDGIAVDAIDFVLPPKIDS